jgi:DNA-binding response OmpR family regulator
MANRILIVDDDQLLRRGLAFSLEGYGYSVFTAESAEDALGCMKVTPPDLILLDIGLPGMDGLEAIQQFKPFDLPIIILTARRRKVDEILGLELGAVDYITKPYDLDILHARVKAVLRQRYKDQQSDLLNKEMIILGNLVIDLAAHMVTIGGEELELSPREFSLFSTFALQPNRVISIDDLLSCVWGAEFVGQPQVIYVHIRWLRKKLEKIPTCSIRIETIRKVGYKLVFEESLCSQRFEPA